MINSPCMDCPRQGCGAYHGECKEYLEYDKERKHISEMRRKEHEIDEYKRANHTQNFRKEIRKGSFRSSTYR